jgi:hypothetical protein
MENESAGKSRSMHMAYAQGKGTGRLFLSLFLTNIGRAESDSPECFQTELGSQRGQRQIIHN